MNLKFFICTINKISLENLIIILTDLNFIDKKLLDYLQKNPLIILG